MVTLDDESASLFGTRRRKTVAVLVVLGLATVPYTWTPYISELVFVALILAILGISWNLLAGYAGQISLGHAAFFGVGAFVSAWLTTPARAGLPAWVETPMLLSLVGGAVAAALLALVTGPVVFRLTGHYFAIGTLALATIVQLVVLDQRQFSGGSTGFYVEESLGEDAMFLVALAAAVLVFLAAYWIVQRDPGLGMRAIHGDEDAASSLGVYPLKYKLYAFVVTAAMAGLAGGLFAQYRLLINAETTLGVEWMIDTLVVVILGGMGSILGPVVGAVVFFALDNTVPAILQAVVPGVSGGLSTAIEGVLLVVVVIFAPEGVYGFVRDRVGAGGSADGGDATDAGDAADDVGDQETADDQDAAGQ